MRIVHVVQRFAPDVGGTETHVREVATEQARRGHDVLVVTSTPTAPGPTPAVPFEVARFPARHFRGDYLLPPWLPLRGADAYLAESRPDVLHAHGYRFASVEHAARAARATGAPLVVTAHGFYPPESALVAASRLLYDARSGRRALATASRCVAVTGHEVAHYAALGVDKGRVDVVPNGIPPRALAPGDGAGFRKRHGLEGPVVLFLARLAHDKGLLDLVRAAGGLDATVVVCGRDAGAEAAAQREAPANVRFLGPVPDARDAFAACDVFVLPSHYEAFGIVLLEAMAQGKPVVATTAGGMPEVVGDAGALVPPGRPEALRAALASLLDDAPRRARLGEAGRARAGSYLWTSVVDALEETYARALRR